MPRSNVIGNPPAYNQGTEGWIEAQMYSGGSPSLFWVDSSITWVANGQNVLAIQVHNFDSNSSDMSCIPFLTIGRDTTMQPAGRSSRRNLFTRFHAAYKF